VTRTVDGPGAAVEHVAVLSMHTSPLAQPGSADAGGMNVYVRELVAALAQSGVDCTTYVRRWSDALPKVVDVEPGFRVVHIDAGPPSLAKEALPDVIDAFADGVRDDLWARGGADVLHANYWLSGVAGHRLKHELDLPLVCTFHTLARVKAAYGDPEPAGRDAAEAAIIGCSDAICVSCTEEERQVRELYELQAAAHPNGLDRIEIVAPGVEHAFFSPGDRVGARTALRVAVSPTAPLLLFVGRLQALKGPEVAVRTLAHVRRIHPDAVLVIVGGPSGAGGHDEVARLHRLVDSLGLRDAVHFVDPQPHHLLASYYRAADVVLVPSRSESFGLVALEAAACGAPVVASAVGGLTTLVDHGRTGFLVDERDPAAFAAPVIDILDDPFLADRLSIEAATQAGRYTWIAAAARLQRLYGDLTMRSLVTCAPS
jgi:D-inositol-3-phosphate glycosyltransferase